MKRSKRNRPGLAAGGPGAGSSQPSARPDSLKGGATDGPIDAFWKMVRQTRWGKFLGALFAVVIIAAGFSDSIEKIALMLHIAITSVDSTPWPGQPVVLYVYPESEFGGLRRTGFARGSDALETHQLYHVVYLAASLGKLKKGDISEIRSDLESRLADGGVAAVVGPSITEATRPVVEVVRRSHRTIPILLESSIDPADLNWDQDGHFYRLSSGVDARGTEIGHVITSLVTSSRPVAIFAEEGPGSYGGKMLRYASSVSPLIDTVPTLRYTAGALEARLIPGAEPDEAIKRLSNPLAVIFFLGLGPDMETLLKVAYGRKSTMHTEAKIVGVMNAYKLGPLFDANPDLIPKRRVYEITDFDFISPFDPPKAAVAFGQTLANAKQLTPALRDQAYSYDEAILLGEAVKAVGKPRSYRAGLERMNTFLRGYSGRGVTGSIVLSGRPRDGAGGNRIPAGQNLGSTILRLACYEPDTREWVITNASSL
ncbi:MAG: hypothetical protein JWN02_903 [Acidobacteria bacterium]|nr:hypothetical protein [Acidobacteriota bacterium]